MYKVQEVMRCVILTKDGIVSYTTRKLRPIYAIVAKNRPHLAAACKLAATKFIFYHERQSKLKIKEVALGFTMWELDKALQMSQNQKTLINQGAHSNWFSEKARFCFAAHTEDALNVSVENIMELESFGNVVIAWNDRSSDAAVKYLFRIFDLHDKGYLTFMDLHDFVEETVELLAMAEPGGVYEGMSRDIVIEILDMIGPQIPGKVTVKDIIASKNGFEIFGMLADATELHRHEHKDD
eukprot:g1408.t1